jgi:hypothetical protein
MSHISHNSKKKQQFSGNNTFIGEATCLTKLNLFLTKKKKRQKNNTGKTAPYRNHRRK